ncbi:MAG: hypothetical protein WKF80_01795 [Thermomicrobiales bacterium]
MHRRWLVVCLIFALIVPSLPPPRSGAAQPATPTTYEPRPLPAPLPIPSGDPDDAAWLLAAHVVTGGEAVVPALLTALQMSGIGVVGLDGSTLLPVLADNQGMAIDEGDLWAMAETQATTSMPLLGFADGLVTAIGTAAGDGSIPNRPDLAAAAMLGDLQTMAAGDQAPARFFARFLANLGTLHPDYPVDLLGLDPAEPTGGLRVSALQAGLIAYRVAADVIADAASLTAVAGFGGMVPLPMTNQGSGTQPCTLTPTQSFIVNQASQASTRGFRLLLSHMASVGPTYDDLGNLSPNFARSAKFAAAVARIVLAYVELFLAFALFDVTVVMEGGGPLIRTKGTGVDGEPKRFVATGRFDTGKSQAFNCTRLMINLATGLDISLPQDGPLGGAPVAWSFAEGGPTMRGPNGPTTGIVRYYPPANPATGRNFSPAGMQADENGVSRIVVAGLRQTVAKSAAARPVEKRATLRVEFIPTAPNLTNDVFSAIWFAIGMAGSPIGLVTLPADLLMRTGLLWGTNVPFTVIDWTDEIAYQVTGRMSFVHQGCASPRPNDLIEFSGTIAEPGENGGVVGFVTPTGTIAGVPLRGDFAVAVGVEGDWLGWGIVPNAFVETLGVLYAASPYITPYFLGVGPVEGGPGIWVPFVATAGIDADAGDCAVLMRVDTTWTPLDAPSPEPDQPSEAVPVA